MPPAGGNSAANNQQLQAMLELERRGELPETLKPQLNAYRSQGLAPPAPTTVEDSNIENATNVVDAAKAARDSVGWGTTGVTGALLAKVPGSSAAGLRGYINTLKANLAFSELAKMRAQSPTGGALGQVSEGEEKLLSGTVASLDPNLPDDQLKAGFDKVIDHYGRWLKSLGYDDAKIAQVMAGENPVAAPTAATHGAATPADPLADTRPAKPISGDIGFATGELPKGFSPEQATAYDAFLKANPTATADQLRSFVHGMGFDAQNADQVIDALHKGAGYVPGKDSVAIAPKPIDAGDGATGAVARGAGDALTLGVLPRATAAVQALKNGDTYGAELARQQGMRSFDEENHFWPRLGGQIGGGVAGGFLFPGSEVKTAASLAKTGAGMGAIYGINSSDDLTNIPDVVKNGVIGATTGAGSGYGLGKLSELFQGRAPMPPGAPPTGNAVADAAARQNIPIIAADASPGARGVTGFLESVPGSSGVVRNRMQAGADAMEQRVGDIVGNVAAPDRTGVGEAVQAGAQNWVRRSGDIGNRLYTRAQEISGGAQISPTAALESLDTQIADLSRTPAVNRQKIDILNAVRSDMADATTGAPRPLDIDSIRQIRTNVREQMNTANIRSSDLDRRLGMVMDAANEDIAGGLANNPRALGAYHRADAFWRDRAERVDNVLNSVIGKSDNPISGEQVMAKIESMAAPKTGSSEKLGVLMSSLRPDEREQVAANIAGSLGRATPDQDFSPARLLTQVSKMSPRARVQIFGRNGADALADLATIAEGRVAATKSLNNSGSGRVSNFLQVTKGLMGLGGGAGLGAATGAGAAAGAGATATMLIGANISAHVLTNPAVARALAQGLRATTAQGARNTVERLGQIATSNPAIRSEVLGIQRRLAQAVNDNLPVAGRAAASPDEGPGNEQ